jgi:glutamine cyclotransferase
VVLCHGSGWFAYGKMEGKVDLRVICRPGTVPPDVDRQGLSMTRTPGLALFAALLALMAPQVASAKSRPKTPVYTYAVVASFPHDPAAFTEGLFYRDGILFEATGLEGRSDIRKTRLETGEVLMRATLPPQYFGEGIIDWKGRLIELTWKNQMGFIYDEANFRATGVFDYKGEGWSLTKDDTRLIMSDGTSELRFLDPETLKETGRLKVTDQGKAVDQLNELEWVKGEILANIWQTDRIARIDPKTGHVIGWIDLKGLLSAADQGGRNVDVLNGIAYDAAKDRLFVTGKLWPKIYQIKLKLKAEKP